MNSSTWIYQLAKTYVHQLCEETGCRLHDSPDAMTNKDRWQKSREPMLLAHLEDDILIVRKVYHL